MKKLSICNEEWNLVEILIKLLAPFYKTTINLQQRSYPSLSFSKIVEKFLIQFYENNIISNTISNDEMLITNILIENLNKYLVNKPTNVQKTDQLVNY